MICKRCQRSLRSSEGLKCGVCESCLQMRCGSDNEKEKRIQRGGAGDKGYQWKCSLCQNYVKSAPSSGSEINKEKDERHNSLLQAVNAISEKFELVNKIQLPKLSSDLVQIKCVADHISQQNDNMLKKILEIEEKRKTEKEAFTNFGNSRYRKRNLKLSSKLGSISAKNNSEQPVPLAEMSVRYRTRRRSYLLHRLFKILNRKIRNNKSPNPTTQEVNTKQ